MCVCVCVKVSQSHFSIPAVDVWSLAFSPDSSMLATGSHNGKINLFSVEEGKKESALDTRGKFIMSIAYVSKNFQGSLLWALLGGQKKNLFRTS